jgi:hypothetical protein
MYVWWERSKKKGRGVHGWWGKKKKGRGENIQTGTEGERERERRKMGNECILGVVKKKIIKIKNGIVKLK